MTEKPIIIYDGKCKLCQSSIYWIKNRDKKNIFIYLSNQSTQADICLKNFNQIINSDSIIYINNNKIYTHSNAILKIAYKLGGVFQLAVIFYIFPNFIRNKLYKLVANNRYKWFGKIDSCEVD